MNRRAWVAVAVAVCLAHLEGRSFLAATTESTDDPRLAVMVACSIALHRAYRALLLLVLAVAGVRRLRTHPAREIHHVR